MVVALATQALPDALVVIKRGVLAALHFRLAHADVDLELVADGLVRPILAGIALAARAECGDRVRASS
jgi:hypothetical protein